MPFCASLSCSRLALAPLVNSPACTRKPFVLGAGSAVAGWEGAPEGLGAGTPGAVFDSTAEGTDCSPDAAGCSGVGGVIGCFVDSEAAGGADGSSGLLTTGGGGGGGCFWSSSRVDAGGVWGAGR